MYPLWYRANGEGELDLTMRLVEDIAERLGEMPGVAAVVLGGSRARGEARPNSVKRLLGRERVSLENDKASPQEP
jgi:sirohydrochlorin ferrochelatase